jgi:hypothetical protein
VSSPGIPNPQNSPEESGQPPPSFLQTPPVTSFFTPFSSRIERAVQQIVSPNKEKLDRTSKDGDGSETLSGVELSVQLANARDKRRKASNQRTNVWCTNCGGQGHLPSECSSTITNKERSVVIVVVEGMI